jgi:hypothetical protein
LSVAVRQRPGFEDDRMIDGFSNFNALCASPHEVSCLPSEAATNEPKGEPKNPTPRARARQAELAGGAEKAAEFRTTHHMPAPHTASRAACGARCVVGDAHARRHPRLTLKAGRREGDRAGVGWLAAELDRQA